MTKKDFEILAKWLRNDVVLWSGTETRRDLLLQVVRTLANVLHSTNSRFDYVTFYKACELEYDDIFDMLAHDSKESWDEWQRNRLDVVARTEI